MRYVTVTIFGWPRLCMVFDYARVMTMISGISVRCSAFPVSVTR